MVGIKKLTKKEDSVLNLLCNAKNPIKTVISSLKISRRMVYKYIDKLKDKGYLSGNSYYGFTKAHISDPYLEKRVHKLRLHGLQFHITFPNPSKYKRRVIRWKGNTLVIYRNSMEIYSGSDRHFFGQTTKDCLQEAFKYYDVFFHRVQQRYGIEFYKEGKDNVELVDGEIEEYNSETGKWLKKEDVNRLQVRATADGVVWMEYDHSKKGINIDLKHPKTFLNDSELIFDNIFNSWRDKTAMTPLEITEALSILVTSQQTQENKLSAFEKRALEPLTAQIKLHLEVQQETLKTMKAIQESLKPQSLRTIEDIKKAYKKKFGHDYW